VSEPDPAGVPAGRLTRVLGVRHHGPGSARTVVAALEAMHPDVVLVEGPPEADELVALLADPGLVPPVAVLAHAAERPSLAAFFPLAVFSPEWQALRWAVDHGVRVRFLDLPATHRLALRAAEEEARGHEGHSGHAGQDRQEDDGDGPPAVPPADPALRADPIAALARAAGHEDPERWWDGVVESRADGDPFDALAEAMAELRPQVLDPQEEPLDALREAHMRKVLRAEQRSAQRIAVVCGAFHAPALAGRLPPAGPDNALLKGLPRLKCTATWVPWTHSRLSWDSGYGAGIDSPGWYHHLFTAPDRPVARWMTRVAGQLRAHDLPASSAHVIESVRLAETLAALRGRPLAGLDEVLDAARAVLCEGDETAVRMVVREVVVGEALGSVPDAAVSLPLEADLRATARRLRLRQSPEARSLVLDLRQDGDLERSRLLHRLRVLGIGWGTAQPVTGTGTFKEGWALRWRPELAVAVVEASLWGTTVPDAAAARLARRHEELAGVTRAVDDAVTAGLPEALPGLLAQLDALSARTADIGRLLEAFPPLARAHRYGSVRSRDAADLSHVAGALLVRICSGLGPATSGLSDEAAEDVREQLEACHHAVPLLRDPALDELWVGTLEDLLGRHDLPGVLTGRLVRLLLDAGRVDAEDAAGRLRRALSRGAPPVQKAHWVEGFLAGGALLLIHDDRLLGVLDDWVGSLAPQEFVDALPYLRRTFGAFEPAEKRRIVEAAGHRRTPGRDGPAAEQELLAGAADVLATVRTLLGVP
jgi:hypothetical protein